MNKYKNAMASKLAYYCNSIEGFLQDKPTNILGCLFDNAFEANSEQRGAWKNQITELQARLPMYNLIGDIILEYNIVRSNKRIDVILLVNDIVFVLEFKNGDRDYKLKDQLQAEDYALDIKNFHKESRNYYVCPILVCTKAKKINNQSIECDSNKQIFLQKENIDTFLAKIEYVLKIYSTNEKIDFEKWVNSKYYPTPTIIEAAIKAYEKKDLSDIAKSEAGTANINLCENKIIEIINYAEKNNKKCLCLITGVPGAGKTLVGLDVVSKLRENNKSEISSYISGNGPLVKVLRKALLDSTKKNKKVDTGDSIDKKYIKKSIEDLIRKGKDFKVENTKSDDPPNAHVLVFDEAQRVWSREKMEAENKRQIRDDNKEDNVNNYVNFATGMSEAHLILEIMDRHKDWAVLICLVGLGQDIFDGEVGIKEWFNCAITNYTHWDIYYSPDIFTQILDKDINESIVVACPRCKPIDELHLKTSIRSFRANKLSQMVDYILNNEKPLAMETYLQIKDKYPIFLTRNFQQAKKWIKAQVKGSQRCGVVACSSAQRLKPEGIFLLKEEFKEENWFLCEGNDLRSSNMMEIVASEFKIQGLELDWSVVCWDADLRRNTQNTEWEFYSFKGTNWQRRKQEISQRYLINAYRVLLTRARQGMVIFVPVGVEANEDSTRNHSFYDNIYNYLLSCGLPELPQ